ncbi:MAG: protein NO VEIN domain-containing protein [Planktothrix sp.]
MRCRPRRRLLIAYEQANGATVNEWVSACNLRDRYWLYVVFDCASSHPRLFRIQDPFGKLIVKTKTSVVIDSQSIFQTAEIE